MTDGGHLQLILLATGRCNAACDYCFEDPGSGRLSIERLEQIMAQVLAYMDDRQMASLTIHWQGGEAMLLPPSWYRQAYGSIAAAADAHGKQVAHGLQTNLLAYHAGWNPIIEEMFGNCVSTSIDVPNRHRRMAGGSPADYDRILKRKLEAARDAGIWVTAISVPNPGTLELGAEGFYERLVQGLGVTDFQINTPFPGGTPNAVKRELALDLDALIRFHCELADLWLARGARHGVRIGPFDALIDRFRHGDAPTPCIWGPRCTDSFLAIDAEGSVAQCDCWVTSYPDHHFGNLLDGRSLRELLRDSPARQRFAERPAALMAGDCIDCDSLALCHGGCPVRAYTVHGGLFEKDPYCRLYQALFRHLEGRAAELAAAGPSTARGVNISAS